MTKIPKIEDNFEDVLGKAMQGLRLDVDVLGERAGLSVDKCRELLYGKYDANAARRACEVLNLNADCLARLAEQTPQPEVELPSTVRLHNIPFPVPGYEEMTVNSYSVTSAECPGNTLLIDAAASFESILKADTDTGKNLCRLFLTHTHRDHVIHFEKLFRSVAEAYAPAGEPYGDASPVHHQDHFDFGFGQLTAIATPGHSPGGMSYLLEGRGTAPLVFVGDALFCESIGKVNSDDYETALTLIKKRILGLPDESILCPGHGPPTTVGFEKKHNPFFA